jgi:hypothetical protein
MNDGESISDRLKELTEAYCDDAISDDEFRELEAYLIESSEARRRFAEAFRFHTLLHFAIRARRSTGAALERVLATSAPVSTPEPTGQARFGLPWRIPLAALLALGACVLFGAAVTLIVIRQNRSLSTALPAKPSPERRDGNVAWLVNAQDCQWAEDEARMPGRDMRAGKLLRLRRGLAEIEFDKGARVILQGPVELVLVSGSVARLIHGSLTARVPPPARGFTILSPRGKIVDLGTEFGLSVGEDGATTVRVFDGVVAAFPLSSGPEANPAVTIVQDQTASIDGKTVALASSQSSSSSVRFVRSIEPPPVITSHSLRLDFSRAIRGSLQDAHGRGIGLTHRLPGTGSALPQRDPNMELRTDAGSLKLTTTRSDLNTQDRMPTGEYLGFRLSELGCAGTDDFEISATIPKIPGLKEVGQFGLYAGASSLDSIRGGLLSSPQPDRYGLFLVNNHGGIDSEPNEIGLMTTGSDLRLTLRRRSNRYSLLVENLTRGSSNTLTVAHPAFLDHEQDLFVGLFAANTQSDVSKTLTIEEVKLTIWTRQPDKNEAAAGRSHP